MVYQGVKPDEESRAGAAFQGRVDEFYSPHTFRGATGIFYGGNRASCVLGIKTMAEDLDAKLEEIAEWMKWIEERQETLGDKTEAVDVRLGDIDKILSNHMTEYTAKFSVLTNRFECLEKVLSTKADVAADIARDAKKSLDWKFNVTLGLIILIIGALFGICIPLLVG